MGVDIAAIGISLASLKAIAYGVREIIVLTAEGILVILPVAGGGAIVLGGTGLYVGISMAISSGPDLLNLISETTQGAGKANFKKYEDKQIEKMYNLEKGQFHREVKDDIISSLKNKNSPYYNEFKKIGQNPDIHLSSDGTIKIVSTQFKGKSFETTWNIKDYLP